MTPIFIDFETYFDDEVTLKKLPMQCYLLHPEFSILSFSVAIGDQPPMTYPATAANLKNLKTLVKWEDHIVVAHNAQFDVGILMWHLGINPGKYFCTMAASRALYMPYTKRGSVSLAAVAEYLGLPNKGTMPISVKGKALDYLLSDEIDALLEYNEQDTVLCRDIYKRAAHLLPHEEQDLIHLTIRKYVQPQLVLSAIVLAGGLLDEKHHKERLLARVGVAASLLRSDARFAELLRQAGVEPPTKVSPTTGKLTWAFAKDDDGLQDLLDHPSERVRLLVEARLAHKSSIRETRLEKYKAVALTGAPFAVPMDYYGAGTGRFSSSGGLNPLNLPRSGPLREAICSPQKQVICAVDLSQVEARVLAALAGEQWLLDAFEAGKDVYKKFGAEHVYFKPAENISDDERKVSKVGVLSLGYYAGKKSFKKMVRAQAGIILSEEEAQRVVDAYRKAHPAIRKLWRTLQATLPVITGAVDAHVQVGPVRIEHERILLPNGMYILYPQAYTDANGESWFYTKGGWHRLHSGVLTNNIVQALARIILTDAERWLASKGLFAAMSVHDELVFVTDPHRAPLLGKVVAAALCRRPEWLPNVPLAAEVGIGKTYGAAK